jgi:hypothetical protein
MTQTQDRVLKFAYFVLGIAVPIAGYVAWSKTRHTETAAEHSDKAHDITVEDSFPASDPPASW